MEKAADFATNFPAAVKVKTEVKEEQIEEETIVKTEEDLNVSVLPLESETSGKSAPLTGPPVGPTELIDVLDEAVYEVECRVAELEEYREAAMELLKEHEQKFAEQEKKFSELAQQLEGAAAVITSLQDQLRRREDRQLRRDPRLCRHFLAGRCDYGRACRFSHGGPSTRAPRRTPPTWSPPSPAPSPRTARTPRSPTAASSSTGKCSDMLKSPHFSVPCCIPTPRSAGMTHDVNPDLEVVDELHSEDNEKAADVLPNAKQDKEQSVNKFEDKYKCKSSFSPRPAMEDKFVSGLVKYIEEYERKESDDAPRADDMWIVVTRRRPRKSSARSSRRRSRRGRCDARL